MIKFMNKKYIDMGDPMLQRNFDVCYENRTFALVNVNPAYYGKKGICVAYPGDEIRFLRKELELYLKWLKQRKILD